ncbi:thioredoxin family protein [Actinospongicola halichondriae]|uniref:thioredoxin family protein n=1 Tax=Actinospongicola halichondriae TaxID=3236844 RepID=UPI003D5105F3
MTTVRPPLPDGIVAVVKRDCPTCVLVEPVLQAMAGDGLQVYSQDDVTFPDLPGVGDDTDLAISYHWDIETVPTLLRIVDGRETERIVGWERAAWESFTGMGGLGSDLPDWRPGCGSLSVDPMRADELRARFSSSGLRSRRVDFAELEDEFEAMYDRGWSDGLPVIPPTEARVARMLEETTRSADDVVTIVPPDLVECTVEKVAVNAVMAGCLPEYLPVVLTALEAACTSEFNMHGLLATTFFSGPIVVVNGPVRQRIGMNDGVNALGQGNRANATIGRALQLVIRNVGGGKPGGVDRATMGSPGKLGWCFPEREEGSPLSPLSVARGIEPGVDAVTLFAGHGPQSIIDQKSRTAESLARTFAACLRSVGHPKLCIKIDAMLVISPEHGRVLADDGWDRARLEGRLAELLMLDSDELIAGADGITEGLPEGFAGMELPKFRESGLLLCHAGGGAGLFSAIIGGWVNGEEGSDPVTREIA